MDRLAEILEEIRPYIEEAYWSKEYSPDIEEIIARVYEDCSRLQTKVDKYKNVPRIVE